MNWGTGIIIAFVAFASLIATMVVISMKQNISLVAPDYYVQEITYQEQIDRMNNTQLAANEPTVKITGNVAYIHMSVSDVEGDVHFFRPSDANLDRKFDLRVDQNGMQHFDLSSLKRGFWRVKINWQEGGKEFYTEHSFLLQ